MVGRTISHYKITEKLGEGGMGVVYKAEDTRLRRTVALKFLPNQALGDEEEKARFLREAQAEALLDHPNIAAVYDIEDREGQVFIVMAFIDGPTLTAKIKERPLPLEKAIDIVSQICEGLREAHEKGVTHRDIKPANIMLTRKGQVKIMDFGLAKLAGRSKLTRSGTTLGTPLYMSPEQALCEETDRRADVWAVGVVLYEMITGRRPFESEHEQAIVYSIINEEPEPPTALRSHLPTELDSIIGKALRKNPGERYQHVEEMSVDLRATLKKVTSEGKRPQPAQLAATPELSSGGLARYRVIEEEAEEAEDSIKYLAEDTKLHRSVAIRVLPQSSEQRIEREQQRKQAVLLGTAVLGVLLALVFAFFPLFTPSPVTEIPLRRLTLQTNGTPIRPAISPNGRHIAYCSGSGNDSVLWVQDLDQNEARPVVGDLNTIKPGLSWSPDSQFIAFLSQGVLQTVAVSGGPVVTVAESVLSSRFAWTPDGESVIFMSDRKLYSVPARGGKVELWFEAAEGLAAAGPAFFSAGEGTQKFLYVEGEQTGDQIIALDRTTGQREILPVGYRAVYAPSGYVIYQSIDPGGIWAVPFSVDTMKATGNPFSISENGRDFSISLDGTLVYLEVAGAGDLARLVWRDRDGNHLGTIGEPQDFIRYPNLSPDGRKVAVTGTENTNQDIWIHEVDRPVKRKFTTHEAVDIDSTWSPSGDRIAFSSGRKGDRTIYIKRSDGSGEPAEIVQNPEFAQYLTDWSPDERTLLFYRMGGPTGRDLWYLKRKENGKYEEVPFLQTPSEESGAKFSPDGRFVAYYSDRSGQREVVVCTFPECRDQRQVSVDGGSLPRWRKDGKELFYVKDDSLMAVPISTDPTLSFGSPRKLFSSKAPVSRGGTRRFGYDITPDGKRFVVVESVAEEGEVPEPTIRVVQNW